jgi:hypothetical protein
MAVKPPVSASNTSTDLPDVTAGLVFKAVRRSRRGRASQESAITRQVPKALYLLQSVRSRRGSTAVRDPGTRRMSLRLRTPNANRCPVTLTSNISIKLNGRVSLGRRANQLNELLEAIKFLCNHPRLNPNAVRYDNGKQKQKARTAMPKKRPIPKPQTVIGSSEKPLNLRYAELLHLRRAVREAELRAAPIGPNATQERAPPAID